MVRIAHTTDFSEHSRLAFLHALRIAVAARGRLDILHVRHPREPHQWEHFPQVREALAGWGMLPEHVEPPEVERLIGVHVAKIELNDADPVPAISTFLMTHRPDVLVLATHGREGMARWLRGSVAGDVVERAHVPALLVGPESRGFVEPRSGAMAIRRVLVPVDREPSPARAFATIAALLRPWGVTDDALAPLHVGDALPDIMDPHGAARPIARRDGPVVDTIVKAAEAMGADLIAIPTTGRHGFLDAMRGGTTAHVVAHARCPVLTLPLVGD